MKQLCMDIGYHSLNKYQEQLCGDHVDVVEQDENSQVIVLADGLGSGVKASILSTLTAKIISTMMAQSMPIEECVATIAATLPVCAVRGVAYSTFTIIRIANNEEAEIIQYDNPQVILLRDGKNYEYPSTELEIGGKKIYKSKFPILLGDIFVSMSDGVIHAGVGKTLNYGWQRENIIDFLETVYYADYSAKTITTILLEECDKLYGGEPGDDTTVCTLKIRKQAPLNLVIGPPSNRDDCHSMMEQFFTLEGKHIVCGGTTSSIAADYLEKTVFTDIHYLDPTIPPIGRIDGVDLVTEGVITINRVLTYAENYVNANEKYAEWSQKQDGASLIARMLFEEATTIRFFVGKAVNPAHQNPALPINFSIKMRLVAELVECLQKMGKKVFVTYF